MKRPDWLKAAGVEEVCSVSTCVSEDPDGWIDRWLHNEMWAYDSPELAWSVVSETARGEFDLYAYQMFPVEFVEGEQRPFAIPPLHVQPLPGSFERLGYDAVSRSYCMAAASSVRHFPAITWPSTSRRIATVWLTMPTQHFALPQSLRLAAASQDRIMLSRFGERNMQANRMHRTPRWRC
jgi:hypothetical protein